MLDSDNPLSSDSHLVGEFRLTQLEGAASVTDDEADVQGGSNLHDVPDVAERQLYNLVVERSQVHHVCDRRLSGMTVFGDTPLMLVRRESVEFIPDSIWRGIAMVSLRRCSNAAA